jgi:hypothetical protein
LFWQRCQGKLRQYNNHAAGDFMRTLCSFVIAIGMMVAPLAEAAPLAPGKPAGVKAAQEMGNREWLVLGGIAAVGIGVAIAVSGGRSSEAQNQAVSVQTTTATAP